MVWWCYRWMSGVAALQADESGVAVLQVVGDEDQRDLLPHPNTPMD